MPWFVRRTIVRATQAGFTVSAAVIVTNEAGLVLLLDHTIRPNSGWGLPGGFLEHGEQPDEGIRREIKEETGLDLFDLKMFRVRTAGSHIEMMFRARTAGTPTINTYEIKDLGWFSRDDMPEKLNSGQKALIRTVLDAEFEKKGGSD